MFNKKNATTAFLFALSLLANAQFNFSGTVKNKTSNEAIAGAIISIDKTFIASQTNNEGNFEIRNLKPGTYIIHVSYIGFQKITDTIILSENKKIDFLLEENTVLMDEVVVSATRVTDKSAMVYSTISKEQIAEQNVGQDLPFLLNQQPSVVTTSDAGAGVGYTGIRIRGVDATRINTTINGIPLNDAESQGTYWVDIPDIASSIDNIQIQRGVGTSTNGAGAFGASLNIQTTKLQPKPYGAYNTSYGSFNTLKNTISAGTGLLNNHFAIDTRLSKIYSDGFIDRASSDLKSYYLSGAYYAKKSIVKFITFSGIEETYQAWYGIPEARLKGDTKGMKTYINNNYLDADEANTLLNSSNRTYNYYTYKNQVDNYKQDYYQLHFSHEFNKNWNANIALHYTKGKGYYEEFKKAQSFSNYGLQDIIIGNDTIASTNLVRRRWLDNNFYGTTFSLNYSTIKNWGITFGGAWNNYQGLHYGEIIWAQFASNSNLYEKYYKDTANKTDFNAFVKINYLITKNINLFADVQYRTINYSFLGFNSNLNSIQQTAKFNFFNPKFGINYEINPTANLYASYSVGHKEPSRDDLVQSSPLSRPKAEQLNDLELGYKHHTKVVMWALNIYYMNYINQLILTGAINDVGAYNRVNIKNSYRKGIEAELGIQLLKKLIWNANLTVSTNKIKKYTEYIDNYDNGAQTAVAYSNKDISFSPSIIAGSTIVFEPIKKLKLNVITKYVGSQYLDNTANNLRKLDAFFVTDFRINYTIKTKIIPEIQIIVAINNVLNELYESNGYTWGYIYGGERISENFYFPQAGTNFMGGLSLKF